VSATFDLNEFLEREFAEHAAVVSATLVAVRQPFAELVEACTRSLAGGRKLLFFGNGGSAADAQHLATELTVRYKVDRRALPGIALTTDTSALTAIGNDYGFDRLFSRQIEALGGKGDVAIGITTSGKSPNVVQALRVARNMGLVPAALAGKGGGDLHGIAEPLIVVPSSTTARVQEMHIFLGQMLCDVLERNLGVSS
jgi:D-sedoheptulose 7-phosphate isomerase